MTSVTWNLNQYLVMGTLLGVFALVGFRRGVNRELLSVIGIGLGIFVAQRTAPTLGPQVNSVYRMMRFALRGGLTSDNPTDAWEQARRLPDLVKSQADVQLCGVVVFFLVVLVFYLVGQQYVAGPRSIILKLLGVFTGVVGGFLMAYYLIPIIFPEPQAVITLPSGQMQETLRRGETVAYVVAFFVAVLIALGLFSASGARKRGG